MSVDLDINPTFKRALALLEEGKQHLFITGKAGTGKSTLLNYFCSQASHKPVVLAPTGVAALNVKGQTIHHFFNFYIDVTPEKVLDKTIKPRNAKLYRRLKTIIIDEASMLRADLLDAVEVFLRLYGPHPEQPFGGVQMVFVGDLYQLPPVVNSQERAIFSQHYTSPYFFSAHGLADCKIEVIELEKVYRQQDQGFIDLLNKIRNNSVEAEDIDQLNSRYQADFIASEDEFYISLTTTNKKADQINDRHLQALTGELHCFHADIKGDVGREYFPTATELQLKSGSQIMLLNNDQKKRWVNGSIGVIEGIHTAANGEPYLTVVLQDSNKRVFVSRFVWEVYKFSLVNQQIVSEPVGTFSQFPLRLAWAVTIHKSQGKTFDRVIIDMGRGAFAAGQTYVGLSRCTTFQGIVLSTPIKKQHIRTDPRIFKFLTGYQYRKAAQQLSVADRVELIQQAINEQAELQILYLKANDIKSERVVKPLEVGIMTYQGKEFPGMQAICRKRRDQRIFHVGRILQISKLAG